MKKVFALFLLCVALFSSVVGVAEDIDFSSLSDDDLIALQRSVRAEITNRQIANGKNILFFDQDGIQIYFTGTIDETWMGYSAELIVVNNSARDVQFGCETYYVNDWDINTFYASIGRINAGKKSKCNVTFTLEEIMASSLDEVEEIELELYTYDPDTYATIKHYEPVNFRVNAE